MTTVASQENLDERMERIRKRNEEIEKKHKEAEEDRLMALKDNAMVETKAPKDENWPKEHKYDKLDFTYDQKPVVDAKSDEESSKQGKPSSANGERHYSNKPQRGYKKFPEGEGPPPDPVYNFLADAERDGTKDDKSTPDGASDDGKNGTAVGDAKKDWAGKQQRQISDGRGRSNLNNSFRGRGRGGRGQRSQRNDSHPDYDAWRNERERIDEARISRQKVGEGKWRREWDNEKSNAENEAALQQKSEQRTILGDSFKNAGPKTNGTSIDGVGNILVSVSQDGEVKSVKLTSAPAIGSGRVGYRQVQKNQVSVQKDYAERNGGNTNNTFAKKPHNNSFKGANQKQFQSPHIANDYNSLNTEKVMIAGPRLSVQERLNRNRMVAPPTQQQELPVISNESASIAVVSN